jgi:glyoxylase-like metal-dependent hydrolase (beta-lactamase superfamily II)
MNFSTANRSSRSEATRTVDFISPPRHNQDISTHHETGMIMNLDRLFCIDLDQPTLEGFRKFISAWLYRGEQTTFVVDPGPLSTIPHLVSELHRHQVDRLDYILLTHIHIDHAGGTGALLEAFPEARVICHPEGIRHMVSPEKLWQGSLKVLGPMAETYGEIRPIPADKIIFSELFGAEEIRAFQTPGHAPHHNCYLLDDLLFGGEVAGVHCPVENGIYMRPATPPRFIQSVALDSIERMISLDPRYLVIAHYGLVEPAVEYLQIGRKQLLLWVRGVIETFEVEETRREQVLFEWLLEHDSNYRHIDQLPTDLYARERIFLGNSLRGMTDYVNSLSETERLALLAA